jgi:hypothetical protein
VSESTVTVRRGESASAECRPGAGWTKPEPTRGYLLGDSELVWYVYPRRAPGGTRAVTVRLHANRDCACARVLRGSCQGNLNPEYKLEGPGPGDLPPGSPVAVHSLKVAELTASVSQVPLSVCATGNRDTVVLCAKCCGRRARPDVLVLSAESSALLASLASS